VADELEPFCDRRGRLIRAVADETMDTRNKSYHRLNAIALQVVDAGFINSDLISDLLLEEPQIKPPSSEVIAKR